eukprot:11333153-Karenia_brevis.AAC.1
MNGWKKNLRNMTKQRITQRAKRREKGKVRLRKNSKKERAKAKRQMVKAKMARAKRAKAPAGAIR